MIVFCSDLIAMVPKWNYFILMQIDYPRWPPGTVTNIKNPRWPPLQRIAKPSKSTSSPEPLDIIGYKSD